MIAIYYGNIMQFVAFDENLTRTETTADVEPSFYTEWNTQTVSGYLWEPLSRGAIDTWFKNDVAIRSGNYVNRESIEITQRLKNDPIALARMRACYLSCVLKNVNWKYFFVNPDEATFSNWQGNVINFETRLADQIMDFFGNISKRELVSPEVEWKNLSDRLKLVDVVNPMYPLVNQSFELSEEEVYRLLGFVRQYLIDARDAMQCKDGQIVSGSVNSPDGIANSFNIVASNITLILNAINSDHGGLRQKYAGTFA